jgi:hypothetical protein
MVPVDTGKYKRKKTQDLQKCHDMLSGGCYSDLVTGVVHIEELVEGRSQASFSW